MEERHRCKLCSRTFVNGRALGGHMKGHLATLPLPPKPQQFQTQSSSDDDESEQEKVAIYHLRENPKKSLRIVDPEFSPVAAAPDSTATGSVVVAVQDRESETESTKNPTRQRSKRNRNRNRNSTFLFPSPNLQKKVKLSFGSEPPHAEPEPVVSSVSDASTEEDVAMCLMMLSRDTWKNRNKNKNNAAKQDQEQEEGGGEKKQQIEEELLAEIVKVKRVKGKKHGCEGCAKTFRSSRALVSHRSICCRGESLGRVGGGGGDKRVFECPFCSKLFGSGQALGGHKRSHLMGIAATSSSTVNNESVTFLKSSRDSFIDLNLPAPLDDELSVVSDA